MIRSRELHIDHDAISCVVSFSTEYDQESLSADVVVMACYRINELPESGETFDSESIRITNMQVQQPGDWRAFIHVIEPTLSGWMAAQVATWVNANGHIDAPRDYEHDAAAASARIDRDNTAKHNRDAGCFDPMIFEG